MNREILRLALPNIVSNITVPVMGIASTMIAGNLGGGDTTRAIGSLAVGVSIFNFIYWNCSFLRMGTSGLTAQAYGAKNHRECTATLARTLLVAAVLGALILLLQYPLGQTAIWAMNGDELVAEYFYARIWAVPAGIMLFGLNGWFIGMQNARIPMWIAILQNVVHVGCSWFFAFRCGMGIAGIGYGSVVAQYLGVALAAVLIVANYREFITRIDWSAVFDMRPIRRFLVVNRDIIVRRTRRAVAAPLHPQLDLLVAGRRGGLRRHLPRLVARPAARLHPEQPRIIGLHHRNGRRLHRLDHRHSDRQFAPLSDGRHHGRSDPHAGHARLDDSVDDHLLRHLLRLLAADRQQRVVVRLPALHAAARRIAILHDPPFEGHLPAGGRRLTPYGIRPCEGSCIAGADLSGQEGGGYSLMQRICAPQLRSADPSSFLWFDSSTNAPAFGLSGA